MSTFVWQEGGDGGWLLYSESTSVTSVGPVGFTHFCQSGSNMSESSLCSPSARQTWTISSSLFSSGGLRFEDVFDRCLADCRNCGSSLSSAEAELYLWFTMVIKCCHSPDTYQRTASSVVVGVNRRISSSRNSNEHCNAELELLFIL